MDNWFNAIASTRALTESAVQDLHDVGFLTIPEPILPDNLAQLARAYDAAVASACSADVAIGRSTTRVHDLVNHGSEFDALYVFRPILEACCRVIGQPFKLSTMLARTLHPHSPAQALHADFQRDACGWPMVGFIVMVDEFRQDNGATRFVPGSHQWPHLPNEVMPDPTGPHERQVLACGGAGSIVIYNGSIWHGHTANESARPRRSIQGAFIRREAPAAIDQRARIRPETLQHIGDLAKYLLDVETPQATAAGR